MFTYKGDKGQKTINGLQPITCTNKWKHGKVYIKKVLKAIKNGPIFDTNRRK
jgi:hypothetical protein